MQQLLFFDKELLLLVNGHHTHFFDYFFWFVSSKWAWLPFYASLLFLLFKKDVKTGGLIVLSVVLTIVLADQISSTVFKNLFLRLRPSHEPSLEGIVQLFNGYRGGLYGFVSSHAANTAALATLFALFFKNRWLTVTLIIWALLNGYSRIYLGVHYPGDVLGGVLVGIGSAFFVYWLLGVFNRKVNGFRSIFGNKLSLNEQLNNEAISSLMLIMYSSIVMMGICALLVP